MIYQRDCNIAIYAYIKLSNMLYRYQTIMLDALDCTFYYMYMNLFNLLDCSTQYLSK